MCKRGKEIGQKKMNPLSVLLQLVYIIIAMDDGCFFQSCLTTCLLSSAGMTHRDVSVSGKNSPENFY